MLTVVLLPISTEGWTTLLKDDTGKPVRCTASPATCSKQHRCSMLTGTQRGGRYDGADTGRKKTEDGSLTNETDSDIQRFA